MSENDDCLFNSVCCVLICDFFCKYLHGLCLSFILHGHLSIKLIDYSRSNNCKGRNVKDFVVVIIFSLS